MGCARRICQYNYLPLLANPQVQEGWLSTKQGWHEVGLEDTIAEEDPVLYYRQMDDHQKAVLELLLPDIEDTIETTDEAGGPDIWPPPCLEEDIVGPDHNAEAAFTLLEKDGRPRMARMFQLKARGHTDTPTSTAGIPSTTRQPRTK